MLSTEGDFTIIGKGSVTKTYHLEDRTIRLTFRNVLHAPALAVNLISVSQFNRSGFYLLFGGSEVVICKGSDGKTLLKGRGSVEMYVLDKGHAHASLSTAVPVDLKTWHCRFAHASPDRICKMFSKGLVSGLNITDTSLEGRCISCQKGCQHAQPYNGKLEPNVSVLDLVAFDLWKPSGVASRGDNLYMMVVADSGTLHKHVNFLKDKSNESTRPAFNAYHILAENQMGQKIKHVRTDNTFNSHAWKEYFKTYGIIHEKTVPHSSAQNGLAERAICTIIKDVCASLHNSDLPH